MSDAPIDDRPEDPRTVEQQSLDFPGPEDQERRRDDLPRPDDEPVTDTDEEGGKVADGAGVPLA